MVTLIVHGPNTGEPVAIPMSRAEFRLWLRELRALGKTRLYDVLFTTASRRLQ